MSSHTYHIIGYAPMGPNRQALYCTMSRVGIVQQMQKAERQGRRITHWQAQTKTGLRVLGLIDGFWFCSTSELPRLPKLVDCPICNASGCIVCDYSGLCKPGHWNKWLPWQLDEMRADYASSQAQP